MRPAPNAAGKGHKAEIAPCRRTENRHPAALSTLREVSGEEARDRQSWAIKGLRKGGCAPASLAPCRGCSIVGVNHQTGSSSSASRSTGRTPARGHADPRYLSTRQGVVLVYCPVEHLSGFDLALDAVVLADPDHRGAGGETGEPGQQLGGADGADRIPFVDGV